MSIHKNKIRRQVLGGGRCPLALVEAKLRQREREHPCQEDQPVMGQWPTYRYLYDLVAAVWSEESRYLWRYGLSEKQYFNLKDKLEIAVFGMTYRDSPWGRTLG